MSFHLTLVRRELVVVRETHCVAVLKSAPTDPIRFPIVVNKYDTTNLTTPKTSIAPHECGK